MITIPNIVTPGVNFFPPPPFILPLVGGMQYRDAAPLLCSVVHNGVSEDDPRVMSRLNEATKIVMDNIRPVGGTAICNITAINGILVCPPSMENIIEAHPVDVNTKVFGNKDVTQSWYEIVNNSTYLDPPQTMDNPLTDLGLNGNPDDPSDVRRVYFYPGLQPNNAVVQVTGDKRYLPITSDDDFLIVQNIAALKDIILSLERKENNAIDDAQKYLKSGMDTLQAEVRKHIMDPRNYMFRKAQYLQDSTTFSVGTLGWMRAQMALDVVEALRSGKSDLTWAILQSERRLMEDPRPWKGTIVEITAEVVGGSIYMSANVEAVLDVSLDGRPIPVRSLFFKYLENGPGGCPGSAMLQDCGDVKQPGFASPRRKYRLVANCTEGACLSAAVKLRWIAKQPEDMMVIKNYEAIRAMVTAKFLEAKEDWNNANANKQAALDILNKELTAHLSGIRHTVHVQTYGFGMGDVGNSMWGGN